MKKLRSVISTIIVWLSAVTVLHGQGVTTHQSLRVIHPSDPSKSILFQPPSSITSYSLTWPGAQGAASSVMLNDGNGLLSWTSAASLVTNTAWSLTGNTLTDSTTQFLGSANAFPVILRSNNIERLRISSSGDVGIGTSSPVRRLHIDGGANPLLITSSDYRSIELSRISGMTGIEFSNTVGSPNAGIYGGSSAVAVNTNGSERMRIDAAGNVGMGTASPTTRLDVSGGLRVFGDQATTGLGANLVIDGSPNAVSILRFRQNAGDPHIGFIRTNDASVNNVQMEFGTANTTRMVIGGAALGGNVGIGILAPSARLHVLPTIGTPTSGSGFLVGARPAFNNSSEGRYGHVNFGDLNTAGLPSVVSISSNQVSTNDKFYSSNGGNIGELRFVGTGSDGATGIQAASVIASTSISGFGNTFVSAANLDFTVRGSGATVGDASPIRMRITGDGAVGIGTTAPAFTLDVNATFRATGNSTIGGTLTLSSVAASGASDEVLLINGSNQVTKTTRANLFAGSGWTLAGNNITDATTQFLGTTSNQPLIIRTNNTEKVRVTSDGNVGIGTATPTGRLSVASTTGTGANVSGWSTGYSVFGPNAGSANGAALALAYNTTSDRAEILSLAPSVSWKPLSLYSEGLDVRSPSTNTITATFTNSGRVGIGDTTPAAMLTVGNGDLFQVNSSGAIAAVTGITTSGGYTQSGAGVNTLSGATTIGGTLTLSSTASAAAADSVLMINSSNQVTKTTRAALVGSSWSLTGNTGTSATTNFIGTTDAVDFVTRTNNTERMRVTSAGRVGIGTNTPIDVLQVVGGDIIPASGFGLNWPNDPGGGSQDDAWIKYYAETDENTKLQIGTSNDADDDIELWQSGAARLSVVSGLVGINNTAPSTTLDVSGTLRATGASTIGGTLTLSSVASGTSTDEVLLINGSNQVTKTTRAALFAGTGWALAGNSITDASTQFLGTTSNQPLIIRTNNTEKMRVTSDGKVGIGTAGPEALLHVLPTAGSPTSGSAFLVGVRPGFGNSTADRYGHVNFGDLNTVGNPSVVSISSKQVSTGSNLYTDKTGIIAELRFIGTGTDGSTGSQAASVIASTVSSNYGNSLWESANLDFTVRGSGATAGDASPIRMRITGNGNVGIGDATPAAMLTVGNGDLFQVNSSGAIAALTGITTTGGYTQSGAGVNTLSGATTIGGTLTLSSTASAAAADSVLMINSSNQVTKTTRAALVGSSWSLTGNTGTSATTNFIGTTDAVDFVMRTNNAERMRVTSAGRVGIGTNTPIDVLQVVGGDIIPATGFGLNWPNDPGGGSQDDAWIKYYAETGENTKLQIGTSNDADDDIELWQSGAARLSVVSGLVGINNTAPSTTLDVSGTFRATGASTVGGTLTLSSVASGTSTDEVLLINGSNQVTKTTRAALVGSSGWSLTGNSGTSASTNFIGTTDAVDFVTRTNNTERMRVTSAGNVGIGTTSPSSKLHVIGDAAVAGVIQGQSAVMSGDVLRVGNDSKLVDIDVENTMGIYGMPDATRASIKLGSSGPTISGLNGNVGIGTTSPSVRLHISGGNLRIDPVTVGSAAGQLQLRNPANTFSTNIQAGAQATEITYTLPTTAPSAGQVLSSDASGNMSWVTGLTASNGWTTTGNNGTTESAALGATATNNFLGTTDAKSLSLVTNNVVRAQISSAGVVSTQSDMVVNGVSVGRGGGSVSGNTAVGASALPSNTSGSGNTAVGNQALLTNTTGIGNTAIGQAAQYGTGIGNFNTAVGWYAMQNNTATSGITALGAAAMFAHAGTDNVAVGYQALHGRLISALPSSGTENTAIGVSALKDNTTGTRNVAIGRHALFSNSTGTDNVAVGNLAGKFATDGITENTSGTSSVFLGRDTRALASGQTNQIVIGDQAVGLGSNTVVLGNSSIVTTALRGNVGIGTEAPGRQLHAVNTSGGTNAVVNVARLDVQSSGTPAVGIGTGLEFATETAANNTEVGSIIESVTTNVGNTTEAFDLVFRTMAGGAAAAERMRVASTGNVTATAFFETSDARLKDIIKRDGNVVYYKWKDGRDDKIHIGYVAQEVQKTHPDQVNTDANGMMSVHYIELLVEKIRLLEKRIEELEQQKR